MASAGAKADVALAMHNNPLGPKTKIRLQDLPAALARALVPFDTDGDGCINDAELQKVAAHLTASFGPGSQGTTLKVAAFPPAVQAAIAGFDLDNSGDISLAELAEAARLFREAKMANKRYLRAMCWMTCGFIFLLALAFALVCAGAYLMIDATTTLKAAKSVLVGMDGATLRTAGGSIGTAGFTPVTSSRMLEEVHGHAGRRLAHALDFLPEFGQGSLYHHRRPVGRTPAVSAGSEGQVMEVVQWDGHGRALSVTRPVDDTVYLALGTTPAENATAICKLIAEGQTAIHMALPITKTGGQAATDYQLDLKNGDVYGCLDHKTNGYGIQAIMYHTLWTDSTAQTPAFPFTLELLVECPRLDKGLLCSVSKRMDGVRRRAQQVEAAVEGRQQ